MNIPELVKREVNQIAPGSELILFGSRARSDFRPDSDWDFLILVDSPELERKTKDEIRDQLYELELETDSIISSIIHSKADWENMSITPIYQIIKEEGIAA